jgi:hypothetical protein
MEPGTIPALHGARVADCFGEDVGVVVDLLVDVASNRPAWIVVALDGDGRRTVVPHAGSRPTLREMRIPYTAGLVRTCPVSGEEALLGRESAAPACDHYDVWAAIDRLATIRGTFEIRAHRTVAQPTADPAPRAVAVAG